MYFIGPNWPHLLECMALTRCFSVRLFPAVLFHSFIALSSLHSIYIDLNGPEAAGLDNQAEWLQGGGAVQLATSTAAVTRNKSNSSTLAGCLAVSSDDAFIAHEVQMNISAESGLILNYSNSTLKICHENGSHFYSLQQLASVVRRVTFDCWVNCTYSSTRTFSFFICYGNGSKSTVSKSDVWMTSRPVFRFINDPVTVAFTFTEGKRCLSLFNNLSIAIRANKRTGLQLLRLTLLNSLDAPHEDLRVLNMSNTNTSVTHKNGTVMLSIAFPVNTTDEDAINTIQHIRYCNNKTVPSSGIRLIKITVSNGRLFSNQSIISIHVHSPLEIIHIPARKYWQASPSDVLQLAEMACLRRKDPIDLSPVYAGHVKYDFMSPNWVFNPLTNMNCSVDTNPATKLSSCINGNSVRTIDLHIVSLFGLPSKDVDGIKHYIYRSAASIVVPRADVVHQLPWSISFWFHCGSPNNRLLISKLMSQMGRELIYEVDVRLDRSIFVYKLTTGEFVTVTFLVPFPLNSSLWHHFAFVAGELGVQAFVDGQIMDVGNITSLNMSDPGSDPMTPPPLLDQLGHLNVSVLFPPNVTTPTMLAGFIMVNKSLTDLQAKCVAGCEEQLYINTDIIPYNLLKQLKPVLSDGGQLVSLSGPASLEAYTALLQSIGYVSFSSNPDKSPRNITFHVSDMMYKVHHHMQLIHTCNATEKCGNALNITCEMVDSTTPLCVCLTGLIYDATSRACKPPVSCTGDERLCGNYSSCRQITETEVSCECISGFKKDDDSNCMNINDCIGAVCNNRGTCIDGINTHSCVCPWNYTGFSCETPTDTCLSNPCVNGQCKDNKCVCERGYNGSHCEDNVGCLETGCLNDGDCVLQNGQYMCLCLSKFSGLFCQFNNTESSSTLTTPVVIAIGVSSCVFVILVIIIIAVICTLKKRRVNSLLVEGHRRQRFTYSQYLGETRSGSRRKSSRKSYSFVQHPNHNHVDLKQDSRAAVRRLSMSFGDMRNGVEHMGRVFGSNPGSLHEMTTAGMFRPVPGTNTQILRAGTALPDIDNHVPLGTADSGFTAHDILETQQQIEEEDGEDNTAVDEIISNMFETVIENNNVHLPGEVVDSSDNESENIAESERNSSLPDMNESFNDGLLTPGQIRARKVAIKMLSSFNWTDDLSDKDSD